MFWIFRAARRLREQGILGMNRRNAEFILDHNPRSLFPVVDDKLKMAELCRRIDVPVPEVFGVVASFGNLQNLERILLGRDDFVVKPNCGSGGRGILVITGRDEGRADKDKEKGRQGERETANGRSSVLPFSASPLLSAWNASRGPCPTPLFVRHNGEKITLDQLRQHLSDILSGLYSLGGQTDVALLQQRIQLHGAFVPVSFKGIPDIRVIIYKKAPALAMLRLPTRASGGRANLHQGGLGVGIDLATGITHHAVCQGTSVTVHPDTGASLIGVRVPFWRRVLEMSAQVAEAVGLGYVGIDIVIDARHGPMLLEANARPGLAIQMANGVGLRHKLMDIDRISKAPRPTRQLPISRSKPEVVAKSA
jgi:glutathione synthase/RimK-type ligase-like ATP-grasp enzyme